MPGHTNWARGTFEHRALSIFSSLTGLSRAVPFIDNANQLSRLAIRPAIYHCFGSAKSEAEEVLTLADLGWESLLTAVTGVERIPAQWQNAGWRPASGIAWHD